MASNLLVRLCYRVYEGEYSLIDSISDTESEEFNKYDDTDEMADKLMHNFAVIIAEKAVDDKYKLDNEIVKRINDLHEKDMLQDVTLLEETKSLYPSDTEDSSSEA